MHVDARIEYRLSLFGFPLRWRTRIELHERGSAFVDVQETGPFESWRHVHEFRPHARGTWMRDVVEYRAPLGPIGSVAHAVFVDTLVRRTFEHRHTRIAAILDRPRG